MADYIQIKNGSTDVYPVVDKPFIVDCGKFSASNATDTFSLGYSSNSYVPMAVLINDQTIYIRNSHILGTYLDSSGNFVVTRDAAGNYANARIKVVLMKM